jgi:hypothetical protein
MAPDELLSGAVLAAGAPPGAIGEVLEGSVGVAVPEDGVVDILPVVPGVVFMGAGAADWATAAAATPMLRLSPMVAMMSFCIVSLRKFPVRSVYARIPEWFRES